MRPSDRNPVAPLNRTDVHLAAQMFVGPRLTMARELRKLTKVDLAKRIGKTAGALTQFESGMSRPEPATLGELSLALGLAPGFFVRELGPQTITVEDCHFRSLRSATQRERRQLIARGALICELLELLEDYVDLPAEQFQGVQHTPKSAEDIERIATEVRTTWGLGLGPIPNIVRLLESRGAVGAVIPEDCRRVDAFSTWYRGRPIVFLVFTKGSTSRTRFDAAHELGHLVMHADAEPGSQELERQANRFAGAFLVPRESFVRECPRRLDWDHLYELKVRWRVSVAALVRRAFDLGIYSTATYRRAFVQLNQRGERTHEKMEPQAEMPTLLSQSLALVSEQLPMSEVAAISGLSVQEIVALCA